MTHIDASDGAAVLVRVADAEVIGFPPQTVRVLADSSATGGRLSTQRVTLADGANGASPHHHANSAELFYVLSGSVQLLAGDRLLVASEGDLALVPPGLPHAFAAAQASDFDLLIVVTPGLERFEYFRHLARIATGRQSPESLLEVQAHYDTFFDDSPPGSKPVAPASRVRGRWPRRQRRNELTPATRRELKTRFLTGAALVFRGQKREGKAMLVTDVGYTLAGLTAVGIIVIGARFLIAPTVAAAGFGIAAGHDGGNADPYLSVKGVRDIASGLIAVILLTAQMPHVLGWFELAASTIPIGDAIIVLRHGGPKATAYGVHGATAVVLLATAALLFT